MDIFIGLLMIINGIFFILWGRRANAPKSFIRIGVGLILFGTIAAVGRIVFNSAFQ
jgi:hypothetical protein